MPKTVRLQTWLELGALGTGIVVILTFSVGAKRDYST